MKWQIFLLIFIFAFQSQILYSDDFSYDELDPETRTLYLEANTAKQAGRDSEAIEYYKKLIQILPKAAVFKQDLVDIFVKQKNWIQAEKYSKELLTLDPQNKDYQLQYARILMWSKKSKMSLSELESLLLSDPRDVKAMAELAQIYLNMKEEEKAQNVYRKILQVDPRQDGIRMDLAYSYLRQKKGTEALDVLKKVRRESEHYSLSTKEIAAIYLNQNDYPNAKTALLAARKQYPRDRVLLEQLAYVSLWLEQFDESQNYFNQLKKNWPERKADWEKALKELDTQKTASALAKRPGMEWFSSFYSEAQQGQTPRSVNLTSILTYRLPLTDSFRLLFDAGLRSDQAIGINYIYGGGLSWSFLNNAAIILRSRFEPDKQINRSNWNNAILAWYPLNHVELEYDYESANYYDRNKSVQSTARLNWREALVKPLKLSFETNDYQIDQPSPYFMRIDQPGFPRKLKANQAAMEYEIPVSQNFGVSPGYAYREEMGQATSSTFFFKSHWTHQGVQFDGSVYYREDSLGYRYWFGYLGVNWAW